MNKKIRADNSADENLRSLMEKAGIASYRALAVQAGVSRWQVQQLRDGRIDHLRVAVVRQLANALQMPIYELLQRFGIGESAVGDAFANRDSSKAPQGSAVAVEAENVEAVRSQLQADALSTLESWLSQWPTIAKRAIDNPEALFAVKILPFVRPVEQLMKDWGVEAIAPVDAHIAYDPTCHQLTDGLAQPGELVKVTHSGHYYQGKLLHRAKVKPLAKQS
jgi:hypothetical protein